MLTISTLCERVRTETERKVSEIDPEERGMKESLIIDDESDVALLKSCVAWFLETQDPELDDAVYDGNDRIILKDILLPRISCPLDVNDGTCKDLGLLTQCLETAMTEGVSKGAATQALLTRLEEYAQRERARLAQLT